MFSALTLLPNLTFGQPNRTVAQTLDGASILRKIYDEDQKDRNDVAGDARRREEVAKVHPRGQSPIWGGLLLCSLHFSARPEAVRLPFCPRFGGYGSEQRIS